MRKALVLAVALLVLGGANAMAEIELGFGIAPPIGEVPEQASQGFLGDATKILHGGYSFLWLFYASYDGLVLPPYAVSQMTGSTNYSDGSYMPGYFRPGFLNTFNVGFRPRIGPLMLSATVGVNSMYIYKQAEDALSPPAMGVNLRAGVGFRLAKVFGIMASGTTIFSDFPEMVSTLEALRSADPYIKQLAKDRLLNNLFPTIVLSMYL